ncbi:sulfotransferase [Sphingomonas sp. JC676]|uniref:sulfotransferase n=1 Tax=Sphingomonas sp. JC676 TaxID=2768065 RepID=UPI00165829AA|nr:sulfotransferase [Sphingomonas sp. JC676]MBC9032967.1 sulfotransferase [Sphingomonas sp. JC676]
MYGRADRLLHHVALGLRPLLDATFDLERARWGKAVRDVPVERPVFVTGLARAGTSILTRILHESGGFACASYRDLPFPLAPNSWARLGGKRRVEARERGHGDGLMHDLDSPEAIEEVFWRLREGARYRRADGLAPVAPQQESITAFRDYVRLVLHAHGGGRYLSKNNNNALRLAALIEAFPDAVLVHPFRDPLQQALSLRAQHVRACTLAGEDPFRRRFMTWLGHHEFGADQRPFLFDGAPGPDEDRGHVDYWLKLWISVHEALLFPPHEVHGRQLFVDYDALCANPRRYAPRLGARIGAPVALETLASPPVRAADVSPALLARAAETHVCLTDRFDAALG